MTGLNPNANQAANGDMNWPRWSDSQGNGGTSMNFGFFSNGLIADDFRGEAGTEMMQYSDFFRI